MTYQAEIQPTIKFSGEDSALGPNENETSHENVAIIFNSMFDQYVEAIRDHSLEYTYDTGRVTSEELSEENPYGVPQPIFETITNEEIVAQRLQDLEMYVKGSMTSGALKIDVSNFPKEGFMSFEDLFEQACQLYVKNGIEQAEARFDAKPKQPAHISELAEDPDPETTSRFDKIIGAIDVSVHALTRIAKAPFYHSGAMAAIVIANKNVETDPTPTQPVIIDKELLDNPAHSGEITLAFDLRTIKPEDIRVK